MSENHRSGSAPRGFHAQRAGRLCRALTILGDLGIQ